MKCKDKIQYLTFVDARLECDKLLAKRKLKRSPYNCPDCGFYHTTKIKLSLWKKINNQKQRNPV
jgi:ribosomal protein L37AE/L43A